ncbi:hypothetical protein NN561_008069 [Cricetulus griseus]
MPGGGKRCEPTHPLPTPARRSRAWNTCKEPRRGRREEVRLEEAESRGREENIQQNHANAPPTWVQHTLEIEDDQDKGSQASGQHHPANSVHPHHFQQRRLHGFVLAAGTRLSGRRVRSAEAGTPPRGTSAREAQNQADRAPELNPASFTEALRAPSPGLGVQGAGVGVEKRHSIPESGDSCAFRTRALTRTPRGKKDLWVPKLFHQRKELPGVYPK